MQKRLMTHGCRSGFIDVKLVVLLKKDMDCGAKPINESSYKPRTTYYLHKFFSSDLNIFP